MPEQLDPEQIQDYLGKLAGSAASPSRSSFKHTVYGLRFYFKLIGLGNRSVALPSIRANHKLPTVLSKEECKQLFKIPSFIRCTNVYITTKPAFLPRCCYAFVVFFRSCLSVVHYCLSLCVGLLALLIFFSVGFVCCK